MNKKKYGFVVLHYFAYEMTCRCIDTVLTKFKEEDIVVVIVDNASGNGSGKQLVDYYRNKENVSVILNDKNLGFAKGNNIGYQYLLDNYQMDYIIIMNNDVIIEQSDFLDNIDKIYNKSAFDVLGPDIYSPNAKIHQNPVSLGSEFDYYTLKKRVSHLKKLHANFEVYFWLDKIKGTIKYHYNKKLSRSLKKELYKIKREKVLLHGACYIFSKSFFAKKNLAFNPATFLYFEEEILFFEAIRDGLILIYSPEIQVLHLEDVSTNFVYNTEKNKEKMKAAAQLDSSQVLLELYKDYAVKNSITGNYKIGDIKSENKNKQK